MWSCCAFCRRFLADIVAEQLALLMLGVLLEILSHAIVSGWLVMPVPGTAG